MAIRALGFSSPRSLAAHRVQLPYFGPPEAHLSHAFTNAYINARELLRTTSFEGLARDTVTEVVDRRLLYAREAFRVTSSAVLARVTSGAYEDVDPVVLKAASSAARAHPHERSLPVNHPRFGSHANIHVLTAARDQSANLVTHIDRVQRVKVRRLITRSVQAHHNPLVTELPSHLADVVGLFPRWQAAVDNLYRTMIHNKVPIHIARARRRDYSDSLLLKRGEMIARTEIMRAMNLGREAQWRQDVDEGRLDNDTLRKVWVCSPHDPCPECALLGGDDGSEPAYAYGVDGVFHTEHGDISSPPLHPHCRCTMNVIASPGETSVPGRNARGVDNTSREAWPFWKLADLSDPEISQLLDNI